MVELFVRRKDDELCPFGEPTEHLGEVTRVDGFARFVIVPARAVLDEAVHRQALRGLGVLRKDVEDRRQVPAAG